jgi:methylenetetrahydromethanopterin dehydrogenase
LSQVIKVGVVKAGCIGTLPLLEFLLDERAERSDIDVRVVGTGAKLGPEECREAAGWMIQQKPDLVLLIGPAQQTQGPREAREMLVKAEIPTIVVSDGPTKRIIKKLEEEGLGYIIVAADSMIGARREFLDPAEMVLYNADVIRVLAATGVLNLIVKEVEKVIQSLKSSEVLNLPRIIVDKEKAIKAADFRNPYARAKAIAAHEISRHVAELNVEGCFKVGERTKYVPLIAAGHEMMRIASRLADEAREIEKSSDAVLRKPHYNDGSMGVKRALLEKPRK